MYEFAYCMFPSMHVCKYVYMCVCMCVYMYACIKIQFKFNLA